MQEGCSEIPISTEHISEEHLLCAGHYARCTKGDKELVPVFLKFATHCKGNSSSKGRGQTMDNWVCKQLLEHCGVVELPEC